MKEDPENMQNLIDKVKTWIHHVRWRKAQYGVWSCIKCKLFKGVALLNVTKQRNQKYFFIFIFNLVKNKIAYRAKNLVKIQSALRAYIARSKHGPRYVLQYLKILLL